MVVPAFTGPTFDPAEQGRTWGAEAFNAVRAAAPPEGKAISVTDGITWLAHNENFRDFRSNMTGDEFDDFLEGFEEGWKNSAEVAAKLAQAGS